MSALQVLYFVLVIAIVIAGLKWLHDEWTGVNYYRGYPGAKLIDDAAAQGKLPPGSLDPLMRRLGAAEDLTSEVKRGRADLGAVDR